MYLVISLVISCCSSSISAQSQDLTPAEQYKAYFSSFIAIEFYSR